jgi:hypothetical protein
MIVARAARAGDPRPIPVRYLMTSWNGSGVLHNHCATVRRSGYGFTNREVDHVHVIRAGQVLPAGDGHRHRLTDLPCAAG